MFPQGFSTAAANIGIKDETPDFSVVVAPGTAAVAAFFTQSSFAGPSVVLSRRNSADGQAAAIVTVSKNANVANGQQGEDDAVWVTELIADKLGIPASQVLIASTGVIGRPYPRERIVAGVAALELHEEPDFEAVAEAIMTTDTRRKIVYGQVGDVRVVGIAKGVGMIEPNMATMLTYFFTDAKISSDELRSIFRRVVESTFNCLSIDTDTSTSDSALIMASGMVELSAVEEFELELERMALQLTKSIAADGEGATKVIEVVVSEAVNAEQAKRVAKAIVNSPLVKTAVFGSDPNWGRIAMAIGKSTSSDEIDQNSVRIGFGDLTVYPDQNTDLEELQRIMDGDEVRIWVSLGTGQTSARVWGCDLSYDYVRINAEYTT